MKKILCCICDKPAAGFHQSIMGQLFFPVCAEHLKSTTPAMGMGQMGLIGADHKFIELKRGPMAEKVELQK